MCTKRQISIPTIVSFPLEWPSLLEPLLLWEFLVPFHLQLTSTEVADTLSPGVYGLRSTSSTALDRGVTVATPTVFYLLLQPQPHFSSKPTPALPTSSASVYQLEPLSELIITHGTANTHYCQTHWRNPLQSTLLLTLSALKLSTL